MPEHNSPYFRAGLADGAADAARRPSFRHGYDSARAGSWMYRRGFARGFLAARRAAAAAGNPAGSIDDSPAVIAAMQRGLDEAWTALAARSWQA